MPEQNATAPRWLNAVASLRSRFIDHLSKDDQEVLVGVFARVQDCFHRQSAGQ